MSNSMNMLVPSTGYGKKPLSGRIVALTGISGALGWTLAQAFSDAGARVIGIGRNPLAVASRCPGIDIIPYDQLREFLLSGTCDTLIDLAVLNNSKSASIDEYRAVNVTRFAELLDVADEAQVPLVIAVSTIHALIPGKSDAYAITRREARDVVLARTDSRCRLLTLPKVSSARPQTLKAFCWSQAAVLKPATHPASVAAAAVQMILEGPQGPREVFLDSVVDRRTQYLVSRSLDYVAAFAILIGLGWLMVVIALAIRLDSPGPAIFAQRRLGERERPFTLYKFRTMALGTKQAGTHEVSSSSVTRAGLVLRRLKLDELPQVFNILAGQLGLVGPRPCLPSQEELIEERRRRGIFAMRPGLTGLAQVQGVDMSDPKLLVEWEGRYMHMRGLVLDLAIIWRTFLGDGHGDRVRV